MKKAMQANHTTRWLEDFAKGQVYSGGPRTITERDLLFCTIWCGDGQPHSNEEYSRKSPFGRRIVHGDGTLAIGSGLITGLGMFDESLVAYRSAAIRYPNPVYVSDEITARLEVRSVGAGPSADSGSLATRLFIDNETTGKRAVEAEFTYTVKRKVP